MQVYNNHQSVSFIQSLSLRKNPCIFIAKMIFLNKIQIKSFHQILKLVFSIHRRVTNESETNWTKKYRHAIADSRRTMERGMM